MKQGKVTARQEDEAVRGGHEAQTAQGDLTQGGTEPWRSWGRTRGQGLCRDPGARACLVGWAAPRTAVCLSESWRWSG